MKTMRKGSLSILMIFLSFTLSAQYSLSVSTYNQNFDGLGLTGNTVAGGDLSITNPLLSGWFFSESPANTTYSSGNGSDNTGDTYNFGSTADRALGGLQSGSLDPTIGFYVINNTGNPVTSILISYTGEQWRLGHLNRLDRLDFQYSLNATSLTTGNWADVNGLDFIAPVTTGSTGALNGNVAVNRTSISKLITGINIPNGTSFFFRWKDYDATQAEDGLGIDDFSIIIPASAPPVTSYFRSKQSGDWVENTTWESSPDNSTWSAATDIPTLSANTVTISPGHTVIFSAFMDVDQVIISSGAILEYIGGDIKINDNTGFDIDIMGGGTFVLSSPNNPPTFGSGSPTVNVNTDAIVRVSAAGMTFAGSGVNSNNFVYQNRSVLEYTLGGGFGSSGVTYFPNVNETTIPIFRITQNIGLVGALLDTRINGVFEANGNVVFTSSGQKIFRNGIRGSGNITANGTSGKFIINGTTAELGGTGPLTVPPTAGMEIGSTSGTLVTVTSGKTVIGNITLLPTNTYVELGSNNLTVTGNITGGSPTSYIKTNGSGTLILNNIVLLRDAPIGNSTYNPLKITNSGGHNWRLRVEDVLTVNDPSFVSNTIGAVIREWHIEPSVNPTTTGTTIEFQYNDNPGKTPRETGTSFNTTENVQVWREVTSGQPWGFDWIAVGVAQTPTGTPNGIRTASISNWKTFSPFAISTLPFPLPIKLIAFNAVKINSNHSIISWELAACCASTAIFEVEKSIDGRNYTVITKEEGSATNRFYSVCDQKLIRGINYYRLKMIDADGKSTYSKVVVIFNDNKGLLITTLAPNPVHDKSTITISSSNHSTATLRIFNMAGNIVKQWQNAILEGTTNIKMNVADLAPGIYLLVVVTSEAKTVYQFVKQ